METQTLTPTPFPIMVLDDSLDYEKDNFSATLKYQYDVSAFLSKNASNQFIAKPDKKNKLLIRLSKGSRKKTFRKSFVCLGESI